MKDVDCLSALFDCIRIEDENTGRVFPRVFNCIVYANNCDYVYVFVCNIYAYVFVSVRVSLSISSFYVDFHTESSTIEDVVGVHSIFYSIARITDNSTTKKITHHTLLRRNTQIKIMTIRDQSRARGEGYSQ